MASSTISSKGQTTLPKEIRDYLNLNVGDEIEFIILPDGDIVIRSKPKRSAKGSLKVYVKHKVSVDDMNHVIEKRWRGSKL